MAHVVLMVVGSRGHWRGRRARGDDCFTRVLQGGWEIPQHGGVGHRRRLMMTFSTKKKYDSSVCYQGRDN